MSRTLVCCCVLCAAPALALASFLISIPNAQAGAAPAGPPVSFMNDVAPILKENCMGCHDSKKRKGKLDMSTFESFRKGGSHEDPVVPGKPDESHLITVLTATDKSRMPPKDTGDALPKEKIALIEKWIEQGAKLDAGVAANADLIRELRARWTPPAPPPQYPYPASITALAFTPDGKQLVVGGQHELTFWDVATGKLVQRLRTRAERTYAMVFLPDGKLAVAGGRPGQEGDVVVYDYKAGKPWKVGGVELRDGVNDPAVRKLKLLDADDVVLCLAISPDGKRLASGGSADRLVNVWDVAALAPGVKPAQVVENHADWVFAVAFAPDGKHLLTASRDKTAKVWDLAAKESVTTFPEHQNTVYAIAPNGTTKMAVSGGEDNQVRFWNALGDAKQVRNVGGHTQRIHRLVFHPTKPVFATASADQTVRIWNADNGQSVRKLSGHTDWVYALAWSPDGERLASGSYNGEVVIWNAADGKTLLSFNASPGLALDKPAQAVKK